MHWESELTSWLNQIKWNLYIQCFIKILIAHKVLTLELARLVSIGHIEEDEEEDDWNQRFLNYIKIML